MAKRALRLMIAWLLHVIVLSCLSAGERQVYDRSYQSSGAVAQVSRTPWQHRQQHVHWVCVCWCWCGYLLVARKKQMMTRATVKKTYMLTGMKWCNWQEWNDATNGVILTIMCVVCYTVDESFLVGIARDWQCGDGLCRMTNIHIGPSRTS